MFVDRNGDGNITGVYTRPSFQGHEELPDDNPEIVAFLDKINTPPTDDERIDRRAINKGFDRGLIRVLANRFGITPAELINEIKGNK